MQNVKKTKNDEVRSKNMKKPRTNSFNAAEDPDTLQHTKNCIKMYLAYN